MSLMIPILAVYVAPTLEAASTLIASKLLRQPLLAVACWSETLKPEKLALKPSDFSNHEVQSPRYFYFSLTLIDYFVAGFAASGSYGSFSVQPDSSPLIDAESKAAELAILRPKPQFRKAVRSTQIRRSLKSSKFDGLVPHSRARLPELLKTRTLTELDLKRFDSDRVAKLFKLYNFNEAVKLLSAVGPQTREQLLESVDENLRLALEFKLASGVLETRKPALGLRTARSFQRRIASRNASVGDQQG